MSRLEDLARFYDLRHDVENVARVFIQGIEGAGCQQFVLDEVGLERHTGPLGFAAKPKALEDLGNLEAPANAHIL